MTFDKEFLLRSGIAIGFVASVIAAAIVATTFLDSSSSAEDVSLVGVDEESLREAQIRLEPADPSNTRVSEEDAIAVAVAHSGVSDAVIGSKLVRLTSASAFAERKLVWAVSIDPEMVGVIPALGLPPEGETFAPGRTEFSVVFVDATSGELLFSMQKTDRSPSD